MNKKLTKKVEEILEEAFWNVCLEAHKDVAKGYSYEHRYGLTKTTKQLTSLFQKEISDALEGTKIKDETTINIVNLKARGVENLTSYSEGVSDMIKEHNKRIDKRSQKLNHNKHTK